MEPTPRSWWRHEMEKLSALPVCCGDNQCRIFFEAVLSKPLNKQTSPGDLRRHVTSVFIVLLHFHRSPPASSALHPWYRCTGRSGRSLRWATAHSTTHMWLRYQSTARIAHSWWKGLWKTGKVIIICWIFRLIYVCMYSNYSLNEWGA